MEQIELINRNAIVYADDVSFSFEVTDNPREFDALREKKEGIVWSQAINHIGDWSIKPFGAYNDLDIVIRKAIYENHSAPGLISKKIQLDWGKGPLLYKTDIKDGIPTRVWVADQEIQAWLNTWDYKNYLLKELTDFNHVEGGFSFFHKNKGSRFGSHKIASLEHIRHDNCRLATKGEDYGARRKATHAMLTDFSLSGINSLNYDVYPLFDPKDPFKHKTSILYNSLYTFCSEYYALPKLYGSLEWLRRSTAIPLILKHLSKNSMNVKYHIQSPADFWVQKKQSLIETAAAEKRTFKESDFIEYKKNFLRRIAKSLSSEKNTGKFLHTEKVFNTEGASLIESGWEVNVLDQKIKDFVDAHVAISKHADYSLSANISLHSALGNISESGKSDSGSEQLYALQNYLLTGVDIPEMVVMKPINYAIAANFPGKDIKMGFYHVAPQREEDKSEKDRVKSQ